MFYIGLKNIMINDSISYNYVVENEYSIIKHSGKVAFQRVPRSTCVSVQSSPYKILQGTLQSQEVREFLKKSVISVPLAL